MADILDKVPPALKSLWHLENELRSALQDTILMRKAEAGKHMQNARGHFDQALKELGASRSAKDASAPSEELDYGEGQREQYGEGYRYRREELSEGADKSTSHGWAGGGSDETTPIPDTKPKS